MAVAATSMAAATVSATLKKRWKSRDYFLCFLSCHKLRPFMATQCRHLFSTKLDESATIYERCGRRIATLLFLCFVVNALFVLHFIDTNKCINIYRYVLLYVCIYVCLYMCQAISSVIFYFNFYVSTKKTINK